MLTLFDAVTLNQSTRRITEEGFFEAQAAFAKPGVQAYVIDELNRDKLPPRLQSLPSGSVIRMLRSSKEVFAPRALKSFANTPITLGHPMGGRIDKDNFKALQVGFSKGDVVRRQGVIQGGILVQDENAVQRINSGVEEISAGYQVEIEDREGVDPVHGKFDLIQKNIRVNHLAIVERGRAGHSVRIQDHDNKESTEMSLTKKEFEGITIELTDQGVQAVEKLEAKIDSLQTLADSKDGEIKTLTDKVSETEAALDVAKKQQLTDADVEALVTERVALTDSAKALFDKVETEGKSPREIKEQVINHHLNDSIDLTDKDDAYVNASFATLQATAKKTPGKGLLTLADSLKPAPKKETTLNDWRQPVIAAHQNKMDAFKGSKE